MWDEKCLIKVSKCSKISLYWIFYTKNRIFFTRKDTCFSSFLSLDVQERQIYNHKKDVLYLK